ncbi:OB-fold domain-containing protein [Candidatus Eisenbacteria bacterium]|uniref:OB-fold domain-containing protein n=1 Tax=Eiseniibacteriota bacterium TaxID=2212470 RepID=A0ABV6YQU4_UNCEI
MISYIKGTLVEKTPARITIDAGGLGYGILIPLTRELCISMKEPRISSSEIPRVFPIARARGNRILTVMRFADMRSR